MKGAVRPPGSLSSKSCLRFPSGRRLGLILWWPGQAQASPGYHIAPTRCRCPGKRGGTCSAFEQGGHRLFVLTRRRRRAGRSTTGHAQRSWARSRIPQACTAIALAAGPLGRGYISAGRANSIVVFDSEDAGAAAGDQRPRVRIRNAILLRRGRPGGVFSFNGHGRNVTAVDATNQCGCSAPSLWMAKPEFRGVRRQRGTST